MSDLFAPIDNYCERIDASFWAEPLNAISNAAFIIAAVMLFRLYVKRGTRDYGALYLIWMVKVVGVGSFLFHTFATGLAMLADVIPIAIFVLSYIAVAYRRLLGFGWGAAVGVMAVFMAAAVAVGKVPAEFSFNGSIAYFPCLCVLVALGALLHKKDAAKAKQLWLAVGIFCCSLVFRSVDMQICESLPIGTHFLWHSLNGVLLYKLVAVLLR